MNVASDSELIGARQAIPFARLVDCLQVGARARS
jgi:hypothetical protein